MVQPFPGVQPVADDILCIDIVAGVGAVFRQQADYAAVGQVHGPGNEFGAVFQRPHAPAEEHDRRGKGFRFVPAGRKHVHAERNAICKAFPDERGSLLQHFAVTGFAFAPGVA